MQYRERLEQAIEPIHDIVLRKKILVGDLQAYAATVAIELGLIESRITRPGFATLGSCFAGFDASKKQESAGLLRGRIAGVLGELQNFSRRALARQALSKALGAALIYSGGVACCAAVAAAFFASPTAPSSMVGCAYAALAGSIHFQARQSVIRTESGARKMLLSLESLQEQFGTLASHFIVRASQPEATEGRDQAAVAEQVQFVRAATQQWHRFSELCAQDA